MRVTAPSSRALVASLALALLAVAPFLPGLPGAFVFDDYHVIVNNRSLALHGLAPDRLLDAALSTRTGLFKRPLAMLSFAANRSLCGLAPGAWKLTNIVIHALNALLVYVLLRRLLPRLCGGVTAPIARLAWLTAALWAVHPLNLTAVLYVVQRMTSLSATFMLVALVLYAGLRNAAAPAPGRVVSCGALIVLSFTAALLTKETALLLPLYLLVLELLVFRFRGIEGLRRPLLVTAGTLAGLALAWTWWRPEALLAAYATRDFTLGERLLTESRVLVWYLRLLVLPEPGSLGLFHDDIALSRGLLTPASTLPALAALGAMLAICAVRRWPLAALACAWFLVGHLLESSVWPLEIAHEHRNYLPAIGVLSLLVVSGERVIARQWQLPAATAALLILGVTSGLRAFDWRDALTQAERDAAHHPASSRAQYELGRVRLERARTTNDPLLHAAARGALERAAELAPESPLPVAALLRVALGDGDEAHLATLLARARGLRHAGARAWVLENVVRCQVVEACPAHGPVTQALAAAALSQAPAGSRVERDAVEWLAIFYLRVLGDAAGGLDLLRQLAADAPDDVAINLRLGEAFVSVGQTAAARACALAASEALPWHAEWSRRPQWRRLQRLQAVAATATTPGGDGP